MVGKNKKHIAWFINWPMLTFAFMIRSCSKRQPVVIKPFWIIPEPLGPPASRSCSERVHLVCLLGLSFQFPHSSSPAPSLSETLFHLFLKHTHTHHSATHSFKQLYSIYKREHVGKPTLVSLRGLDWHFSYTDNLVCPSTVTCVSQIDSLSLQIYSAM